MMNNYEQICIHAYHFLEVIVNYHNSLVLYDNSNIFTNTSLFNNIQTLEYNDSRRCLEKQDVTVRRRQTVA